MIYRGNAKDVLIEIRKKILEKGIQDKDIASELGKTKATISATWKQDNVKLNTLYDICEVIGCDIEINIKDKKNWYYAN